MDSHVTIRPIESTEHEALRKLARRTFVESFGDQNTVEDIQEYVSQNFSSTKVQQELSNPDSSFYFAVFEDKVVGYLKLNAGEAQTDNKLENALEIERIYVLAEYQGNRIGQVMFEKALQSAREGRHKHLWLAVWEKNVDAIRFYKRHGFEEFASHRFQLGSDMQRDIMMKIDL